MGTRAKDLPDYQSTLQLQDYFWIDRNSDGKTVKGDVQSIRNAIQTKTVISSTNPVPDWIGQPGVDANGKNYVAIALTGTMWQELSKVNNDFSKAADGTISFATFRDKEIKFSKDLYLIRSAAIKDCLSLNALNKITGINSGTGTITVSGGTLSTQDYDGSCVFSTQQISKIKRFAISSGGVGQIFLDSTFTAGQFKKFVAGIWLKKSALLLTNDPADYHHFQVEMIEATGGTLYSTDGEVSLSDMHVGYEYSFTVGSKTTTIRFMAEYNDWIFLAVSYPELNDPANTLVRANLRFHNSGSYGSNINMDFLNPFTLNATIIPIADFIYPESSSELYKYSGVEANSILSSNLGDDITNGATGLIHNNFTKDIYSKEINEKTEVYNQFKQPIESGYDTQFPVGSSTGTNASITVENNDGTFPFSSSEMAKIYKLTYNTTYNNQMVAKGIVGSCSNYVLGLWINKTDINNLPIGLRFYHDKSTGAWVPITKSQLLTLNSIVTRTSGDYTLTIRIVAETSTAIFLTAYFSTVNSASYTQRLFYMEVTPGSSGSGYLRFCNVNMLVNVNGYINGNLIYPSTTDTVRELPTFEGRVLDAVKDANIIEPEVDSYLQTYPAILTNIVDSEIDYFQYGAKLQNFLKKARDYRASRFMSKTPTVIILGDSVTGGIWATDIQTWLYNKFNIPIANIEIHWYGGYSIENMFPFIENIAIMNNPDLFLFVEYETDDPYRLLMIEEIIKLARNYTSADIGIITWSMQLTVAQTLYNSGSPDISLIQDDSGYEDFNWYRDLARKYNCELIDTNQAIVKYVLEGNDPTSLYSSGPHMTSTGYQTIFTPEVKKHFNDSNWQKSLNHPNPLGNKEEILFAHEAKSLERFKTNIITFNNSSLWTKQSDRSIRCSTQNEFTEIYLQDTIGFEIISVVKGSGSVKIEIKPEGGAYGNPSALAFNSKPLQYTSEILSITYSSDWDNWRMKRPFMKGIVNSNILSDGTLISGQYKIIVSDIGAIRAVDTTNHWVEINGDLSSYISGGNTLKINGSTGNDGTYTVSSVAYQSGTQRTRITFTSGITDSTADGYLLQSGDLQFVTCAIKDPSSSVLATFIVGKSDISVLSGALTFPLSYNGENNYYLSAATLDNWGQPANANFEVNDEYEFYIKSNWINNALMTSQFNKVFGYARGNYYTKLTINAATTFDFHGIRIFH